jgi:hypothetical protein
LLIADTTLSEATEDPIIIQYFNATSDSAEHNVLYPFQYLTGFSDNGSKLELKYNFHYPVQRLNPDWSVFYAYMGCVPKFTAICHYWTGTL